MNKLIGYILLAMFGGIGIVRYIRAVRKDHNFRLWKWVVFEMLLGTKEWLEEISGKLEENEEGE